MHGGVESARFGGTRPAGGQGGVLVLMGAKPWKTWEKWGAAAATVLVAFTLTDLISPSLHDRIVDWRLVG